MFSGNFGKGFITGLAESVDREIQADMDMFAKKKSRLGDLALEKSLTEQTRFQQERDANLKEIKMLAAQLDTDADTIQYIYNDKGSLEATKAFVGQLVKRRDESLGSFDPVEALRLAERTNGKVSAMQLANLITPAAKSYDLSAVGDIRPGFMKLFGTAEGATKNLKKSVEAELAIAGAGQPSLADIPAPISGKGLYKWQLFDYSGNPDVAAAKLSVILGELKKEEADATPARQKEIQDEFVAAKAQQDLMSAQSLYNPGESLSEPQIETYNSTISGKIATKYQMAKPGSYTVINGVSRFNTATLGGQAAKVVNAANAEAMREIDKAQRAGINPIEINSAIEDIIIGQNKKIQFVPGEGGPDVGTFVAVKDSIYIDEGLKDDNNQLVFAPLPTPTSSQITSSSASSAATTATGSSVQINAQMQNLIATIQQNYNNQNTSAVNTDLRKLSRMLGPNNQPIGMAQAKQLAGVP